MPSSGAQRMQQIAPFEVMEVMARAQALESAGRDLVHMEVGEPDFPTAEPIVEAGARALRDGRTHYTLALGLPELRAAIAAFYASRYGVAVDAGRIVITPGASGALQLVFWSLLDPGDEVLLADPGYPCNRNFIRLAGGVPVSVPTGPQTRYQLSADLIEGHLTPRTRAVLLASPSNPTGTTVPAQELEAIARLLERHGVALIADEIYHGLLYGSDTTTVLASQPQAYVVNSFSKYFGMTGWRLGWLVAPQAALRDCEKLAQNLFISAPTPAQYAALAAFEPATLEILEGRREAFRERRDLLLGGLRELRFDVPLVPDGAFYAYADVSAHTGDSFAFALQILEQAGVALTPGRDFGSQGAERHLRLAYTTSAARLEQGLERLHGFLRAGA